MIDHGAIQSKCICLCRSKDCAITGGTRVTGQPKVRNCTYRPARTGS
ncbi:hypothetical protein [Stutzerimonas stutzeri]|uniref:Uncharacterized protein n=1 Tax=Stutzerimonas stutzeri TaxID=316 RepID=A0A6I6LLK0_STUST|nr:hypothetical protein [Stutzerimonas stutzeri]QGZ29717.1 hypothetical protein GQA94_06430 [Stutzerimonas stutzeri]